MAVKVFKKRKEYIDMFNGDVKVKVTRWLESASYRKNMEPLTKEDMNIINVYNKICYPHNRIEIHEKGIPYRPNRNKHMAGPFGGIEYTKKATFDFIPAKYSIGLVVGSCNYKFIKEFIEMLPDYTKDDILTKYIDGNLNVLKGLVDAGACYICKSVETVTNERNFNPERYYDKRDMTKTNLTKLMLDNLNKV